MNRALPAILAATVPVLAAILGCATTRAPDARLRFGAADEPTTFPVHHVPLSFGLGSLEIIGTSRDLEGRLVVLTVQIGYHQPADLAVAPVLDPDAVTLTLGGVAPVDTWGTALQPGRESWDAGTGHRFVFRRADLDSAAAAGDGLEGVLTLAGYARLGERVLDLPVIRVVSTDPSPHP